jgi:hypothetical protein
MIADSFGPRTFANMEVALERACKVLGIASERHQARRHIASKIVECAKSGDGTLGFLLSADDPKLWLACGMPWSRDLASRDSALELFQSAHAWVPTFHGSSGCGSGLIVVGSGPGLGAQRRRKTMHRIFDQGQQQGRAGVAEGGEFLGPHEERAPDVFKLSFLISEARQLSFTDCAFKDCNVDNLKQIEKRGLYVKNNFFDRPLEHRRAELENKLAQPLAARRMKGE